MTDVEFGLLEDAAAEAFDIGLMGEDLDPKDEDLGFDGDVGAVGAWNVGDDWMSFALAHSSASARSANFLKTGWEKPLTWASHSSL